jgi:hypothetical protein
MFCFQKKTVLYVAHLECVLIDVRKKQPLTVFAHFILVNTLLIKYFSFSSDCIIGN